MPVRILVTEGTRADCKEAVHLIEGISAQTLLAGRGYDTNDILTYAASARMQPVIPPKKNRREQRGCNKYLYKLRHLVENCFLALKRRGIATRYTKISDAFIAALHVRCIAIWAAIRANPCRRYLEHLLSSYHRSSVFNIKKVDRPPWCTLSTYHGTPDWIRTSGLVSRSHTRYPTAPRAHT